MPRFPLLTLVTLIALSERLPLLGLGVPKLTMYLITLSALSERQREIQSGVGTKEEQTCS